MQDEIKAVIKMLNERQTAITIDKLAETYAAPREYAEGYKHGYQSALLDIALAFTLQSVLWRGEK